MNWSVLSTGKPNHFSLLHPGCGTVFQLSPGDKGTWLEQVILRFNYADGAAYGGLVLDSTGAFYGATNYGGTYQHGVVFSLKRGSNGAWIESVLHTFQPIDRGWLGTIRRLSDRQSWSPLWHNPLSRQRFGHRIRTGPRKREVGRDGNS
jgi:hypothetical protein